MLYGKIVNNGIQYAPKTIDGVDFPSEEVYRANGYLPVFQTSVPTGYYEYTPTWEVSDDGIRLVWYHGEEELDPPDIVDDSEALAAILEALG